MNVCVGNDQSNSLADAARVVMRCWCRLTGLLQLNRLERANFNLQPPAEFVQTKRTQSPHQRAGSAARKGDLP